MEGDEMDRRHSGKFLSAETDDIGLKRDQGAAGWL